MGEQITGSAKARGAFNKLLTLKEDNPDMIEKGAVAASTGNHGAACSKAMHVLGIKGVIYVPAMAEDFKRKMIEQFGSTVEQYGHTCAEAESKARAVSQEKGIPYISPSNDWDVIAGQGALGYELHQDLPEIDVLFVAVGGGGIIGGMAAYLKSVKPSIKIIGCETDQSPVMSESQKAGKILEMPHKDTLSDGTAGGVEQGSVTFNLCKRVVDQWVVVTEEDMSRAIYNVLEHHHKIIEGSAGLAVAGYVKTKEQHVGKTVAILSCGSNISIEKIKAIIKTHG
ncbi:uncharacterized protein LOC116295881 isoform X2 [Actinia tenebrosa]|uniref:L-serine deaminase n=1 Tax=Actinia tenebrosa TaxID=6105 RepID=A0A6P8I4I5_ACTTE|nr:uncharacterized protein LOC116295881 isoform X2 [Actinia tenebrosa]